MHDGRLLGALAVGSAPRCGALSAGRGPLARPRPAPRGLVLENERLIVELRASRQRLVVAQDDERRRLDRDLHDGVQQQLLALAIDIQRLAGTSHRSGHPLRPRSLAHATAQLPDAQSTTSAAPREASTRPSSLRGACCACAGSRLPTAPR